MPAGQVYRLTRAQRQQQRQFDPNLLGLQLADQPAIDLVPENPGNGYLRRYQGRQQWSQWPVLSRLDATGLELPDQPLIDLEPWTPTTATYQRYRGRPQQAQWPVYSRLDAAGLELPDLDPTLVPEIPPQWRRDRIRAPWQQYTPIDPNEFPAGLPDQDVNLMAPWADGAAVYALRRSRASYQQAVVTDPSGLELPDQDVNITPEYVPWWRRPSVGAQWRQPAYFDPSLLSPTLPDQDVNLVPVIVLWRRPPSRAAYQQADYFGLQLPDQDVTLVPVVAPWRRPASRAAYQQAPAHDPLVPLPDQDLLLTPPFMAPWRRPGRGAQWLQARSFDVTLLASPDLAIPDLRPIWVRTPFPPFRWRRQLALILDPSFLPNVVPAPVLGSILTSTAIIDGRTATAALLAGVITTTATIDGLTTTVVILDGARSSIPIIDGREGSTQ